MRIELSWYQYWHREWYHRFISEACTLAGARSFERRTIL